MDKMSNSGTGAVFFLGSRAHYQILDQPSSENGNASTETIYQNPSIREPWPEKGEYDNASYVTDRGNWNCQEDSTGGGDSDKESRCVKRRIKRASDEKELQPAILNDINDNDAQKAKPRRVSLLTLVTSLARRRRRLASEQHNLRQLHTALACTYRESCRCLDCQSRYFECDEMEDYSSDDSDFASYCQEAPAPPEESDDEVFVDETPGDNTSTDLLIEGREKMSVSSDTLELDEDQMQLEVAAGTPVLLNYLLTHPITCAIQ